MGAKYLSVRVLRVAVTPGMCPELTAAALERLYRSRHERRRRAERADDFPRPMSRAEQGRQLAGWVAEHAAGGAR